jgi:hypothetical protein
MIVQELSETSTFLRMSSGDVTSVTLGTNATNNGNSNMVIIMSDSRTKKNQQIKTVEQEEEILNGLELVPIISYNSKTRQELEQEKQNREIDLTNDFISTYMGNEELVEAGMVAQTLKETVLDNLVTTLGNNDDEKVYTINYNGISPYLISAIKALNRRTKTQQQTIDQQQQTIDQQQQSIDALTQSLNSLIERVNQL